MNEYNDSKVSPSKMKHTVKNGKRLGKSSKSMKRKLHKRVDTKPPTRVIQTTPYYKDLTGITNKLITLTKKINDIDNTDPRKDMVNHLINNVCRGNLSMLQTRYITDGNRYQINSVPYWENRIRIADELKREITAERDSKISNIKRLMYKSDNSSQLVKKLVTLNDTSDREKRIDRLTFSSEIEQLAHEKECVMNVIEANKHLNDMFSVYTGLEQTIGIGPPFNEPDVIKISRDIHRLCDTSREEVLDVSEILYKLGSFPISDILKKTKRTLDNIRDNLIRVQHNINKIDN